jgi:hypothetical protein
VDITEEILRQHDEQRHMFALLDEIDPDDTESLGAVWERLAVLLEVHAEGEERLFYPKLLTVGQGPTDEEGPDDEVQDAIKDHNEIRDAVGKANGAQVGTDEWWDAVRKAREENDDHMGEEEREDLPDFRRHASLQDRHDIGRAFAVFCCRHSAGIEPKDKDPEQYVEQHS